MTKNQSMRQDRPAHVAKRKQNLMGQEVLPVKKKSKSIAATHDSEEPSMFISPPKDLDAAREIDEDSEHEEPRHEGKMRGDQGKSKEPNSCTSNSKASPTESVLEHSLRAAQKNLLTMIEEGADDETIANQVSIIDKLTARGRSRTLLTLIENGADDNMIANQVNSINNLTARVQSHDLFDEPSSSDIQIQEPDKVTRKTRESKTSSKDAPRTSHDAVASRLQRARRGTTSAMQAAQTLSILPSPSSERLTKRTRILTAKAKANEDAKRTTNQLLKSAFPINNDLTTEEGAELSKVHITYDESQTNKQDSHQRKINSTKGVASGRLKLPERGSEARIRAQRDSPTETPRGGSRINSERLNRSSDSGRIEAWRAAHTLNSVPAGKVTLVEDRTSTGPTSNGRSKPASAGTGGDRCNIASGPIAASTFYTSGTAAGGLGPKQRTKPSLRVHPQSGKLYYPEEADSDYDSA